MIERERARRDLGVGCDAGRGRGHPGADEAHEREAQTSGRGPSELCACERLKENDKISFIRCDHL